jgi:hypothetical protein
MPLKIVKGSDPIHVDQIVLTGYAPPGGGKTSLGFTADAPILLDFDRGAYRSANRGDSVDAKTWQDAASITADDLTGYKTVVVDTVGRALDALAADIIGHDPKMGRGGALTLQGFGQLKTKFSAWLKLLRSFGVDVVLLAHVDEQRSGDETVERIDAQGASKNEIYKCSDAMGRLAFRNGKRVLLFSPTETAFGKNPAALDPLPVPHFDGRSNFLGDVIRTIKAKLNEMTEEQREIADLLGKWSEKIGKATSGKALNSLLADVDKLDPRIRENAKRMLWAFAKSHGFAYDKVAGFSEIAEAVSA